MRQLSYAEAIREAQYQALEMDDHVFLMGQGVDNPWCVGTTTAGIYTQFGPTRVRDVPISENAMTGAAIGAAMAGMRPIVFHPRMDFMYLAMDQIFNHAALWHYMFDGQVKIPITIRGIINRGNEQAAQHSQSPYSMFAHSPGLKIVMPSTPADAKGLFLSAVFDDNPVIYIDDRWLYPITGEVPSEPYRTPIGKGAVLKSGHDLTVIGISYLAQEALLASQELEKMGFSVEVIDPRTIKPIDMEIILESAKKTKRVIVADGAWPVCGVASDIAARVYDSLYHELRAPIVRITLPECPAPASSALEIGFFPQKNTIIEKAKELLS